MSNSFKSIGIVLKSLKYSETSLILDIYTKQKGLRSFIISGVRKAKSKQANVFQPMNIIQLVAIDKQSALGRIKEAKLEVIYESLNIDIFKSSIGVFYIDLFRSVVKEFESNLELFDFLFYELQYLDKTTNSLSTLPLRFGIQLAGHLGFGWSNNFSDSRPCFDLEVGQFVGQGVNHKHVLSDQISFIIHQVLEGAPIGKLDKISRKNLLDALVVYFKLHVAGFSDLRSLAVLRTILA